MHWNWRTEMTFDSTVITHCVQGVNPGHCVQCRCLTVHEMSVSDCVRSVCVWQCTQISRHSQTKLHSREFLKPVPVTFLPRCNTAALCMLLLVFSCWPIVAGWCEQCERAAAQGPFSSPREIAGARWNGQHEATAHNHTFKQCLVVTKGSDRNWS